VAAGARRFVQHARRLRFGGDELRWLAATGRFGEDFLGWLAGLRFEGRIRTLPEGLPFFPDEPILEVEAPLPLAQILETAAMALVQQPVLAATKAARCVAAAAGRPVVDFGMRRAHGPEAGAQAARSAWLAGMAGTSNVEAGRRWAVPLAGTMAHSYVLAFEREIDAFRAYAADHPDRCVLLVDTYDSVEGVRRAAAVGLEMRAAGRTLRGIRIDSGDLAGLARTARGLLDAAGLREVEILVSGGLDEHRIAALVASGAPIDGFGVGTSVAAPPEAPSLDIVYKLVAWAGRPVAKRSPGKATWPGAKQVWRAVVDGEAGGDVLGLAGEPAPATERAGAEMRPLLVEAEPEADGLEILREARTRHPEWMRELPAAVRRLRDPAPYAVRRTAALEALARAAAQGTP
jgi:nicotinate phosphoribosyltransferase